MTTNEISLEEIKMAIERQISHSYLEKYIEKPIIDEDKLFLLMTIFQDTSYSINKQKNFIITSMLVQTALDTHDKVSLDDSVNEPDFKKKRRQLTVLAGDYYSGLYYHLLSKLEDVSMVKILAATIKEINETKMSVYYRKNITPEELLEGVQVIESLLVRRLAEYVNKQATTAFTEDWLLRNKLVRERRALFNDEYSLIFQLLTDGPALAMDKLAALSIVDKMIEKLTNKTKTRTEQFNDQYLLIKEYFDKYKPDFFHTNTKALREG